MAKKDFDEYYNKIFKQYNELQVTLEDMSKEVSNGMIEPERLEALKNTVAPIATSFQTLSYIKYLLDIPTRKTKRKRYNTNNYLLKRVGDCNGNNIMSKNKEIIDNIRL